MKKNENGQILVEFTIFILFAATLWVAVFNEKHSKNVVSRIRVSVLETEKQIQLNFPVIKLSSYKAK